MDKKAIFVCQCHSHEHMVSVDLYDWDNGDVDFCLSVTAETHLSWLKRLKIAVKYLFGLPGLSWHDVMLKDEDVLTLSQLIADYNALKNSQPENNRHV
jgi:hypothetical protein